MHRKLQGKLIDLSSACIAAIVRITYLHTLRSMDITCKCPSQTSPFSTHSRLIAPVQLVPCLNLSVIECSLGIICVSIPPLRPLAARVWPKGMTSRLRGGSRLTSAKSPLHSLTLSKRSAKRQSDTTMTTNPTEHNSQTDLNRTREGDTTHEMEMRPYKTDAEAVSEVQSQQRSYT